jgi:hypothetical protein
VGLISQDAETVNWIAQQANMPRPFSDQTIDIEEARKSLTGYSSGAGEGQATAGEGTSTSPTGGDDAAVGNTENNVKSPLVYEMVSESSDFVEVKLNNGKAIKIMTEDWNEMLRENM